MRLSGHRRFLRSSDLLIDLYLHLVTLLSIYLSMSYLCIYRYWWHPIPLHLSRVVFRKTTAARAPTASFSFVDARLHDGSEKTNIPTTTLVTTKLHAADSEARPYKTRFLLKARTICFRSTQTRFSLFHFGMHPLGIIMFALSPEMKICTAFLLGVRPHPNGPRAMFFQSLQDKNGIRRSKMLPQAQPKCCTFTKSVQQIYCVLGWCACSGQKRHTRWPATTSGCCCLFVPSQTDHGILGLKDFRVKRF